MAEAARSRLSIRKPEPPDEWPYHEAAWTALSTVYFRSGNRRLEASTFLSPGFQNRIRIMSKEGWVPLDQMADVVMPPRTKAVEVDQTAGTPFLTAGSVFNFRPRTKRWLAAERIAHSDQLKVSPGTIVVVRSGTVGNTTITTETHKRALLSDDLLRVFPKQRKSRGSLYAFLRASQTRAMMTSAQYGHIIKHLEVDHLSALPVPEIPDDWVEWFDVQVQRIIDLRDAAYNATLAAEMRYERALGCLPDTISGEAGFAVKAGRELFCGRRRFDAFNHNPVAVAIEKHFWKHANSVETLRNLGVKVWLPNRFKRIHATAGLDLVESASIFQLNPPFAKRVALPKKADQFDARVKNGWILMARSGQLDGIIGSAAICTEALEGKVVSDDLLRIVTDDASIESGYLVTVLTHPNLGRPLLKSLGYGMSVPHIDPQDLLNLDCPRFAKSVESSISLLATRAAEFRMQADALENRIAEKAAELISAFVDERPMPSAPKIVPLEAGGVEGIVPRMLTTEIMPGVEKTPRVCGGEACIATTRIPVWFLEDLRRGGMSDANIFRCYPDLNRSHLKAAWDYVGRHREEIDRAIRENEEA